MILQLPPGAHHVLGQMEVRLQFQGGSHSDGAGQALIQFLSTVKGQCGVGVQGGAFHCVLRHGDADTTLQALGGQQGGYVPGDGITADRTIVTHGVDDQTHGHGHGQGAVQQSIVAGVAVVQNVVEGFTGGHRILA